LAGRFATDAWEKKTDFVEPGWLGSISKSCPVFRIESRFATTLVVKRSVPAVLSTRIRFFISREKQSARDSEPASPPIEPIGTSIAAGRRVAQAMLFWQPALEAADPQGFRERQEK
jgi:hypothetical protein